jgi:hypothetical protein
MKREVKEGEFLDARHPVFLFLFTNIWFLAIFAGVWTVVWIAISWFSRNWMWFARSGSVIAILGGIMTGRPVLRLSPAERVRFRHMGLVEQFTEDELQDQERDSNAMQSGVTLILIGTLIWAYGDLLSHFAS